VSRPGGLPHILSARSRRSKARKWSPSIFGGLFKTPVASPWWSHQCPIWSPRSPPPLPARRLNWPCLFGLSCALSSTTVYLLHHLRWTATVMARKTATADELDARVEAITRGGRTGKKTVVETATSTKTRPRKIKMQRWVTT